MDWLVDLAMGRSGVSLEEFLWDLMFWMMALFGGASVLGVILWQYFEPHLYRMQGEWEVEFRRAYPDEYWKYRKLPDKCRLRVYELSVDINSSLATGVLRGLACKCGTHEQIPPPPEGKRLYQTKPQ